MLKNFIAQVVHATKFFKTPKGNITDLETKHIETETLKVTDTAEVDNTLIVDKQLTVKNDASIKDLHVTNEEVVEKKLTVRKELLVEDRAKIKNADIGMSNIDDIHQDSKVWGVDEKGSGTPSSLVTSVDEYKTGRANENWNGSGTKVSRSNHTHKIPESIKNPKPIIIHQYSSAGNNLGASHTYDGSPKTEADNDYGANGVTEFTIDYNFVGAPPKRHTSANGETYGQGNNSVFGHVKLHTMTMADFKSIAEGNSPSGSSSGNSGGTALTPASLSALVNYTEKRYIKVPENSSDPVVIPQNMIVKGTTTFEGKAIFKSQLQLNESVILEGAGAPSDNTMKIIGIGNSSIAKIQFGDNNKTILRSSNDGHLYIDHGKDVEYVSKISDFEIESIITPNANVNFRKWVPSKEGYYRIYLIGGGGFSAGAYAYKYPATTAYSGDGPSNGYGIGRVYPGLGGGGGPVVIVDLVTANSDPVTSNGLDKSYSGGSIGGSTTAWGSVSISGVTETDGTKYFSGSVSIDKITGGSVSSGDVSGSALTDGSGSLSFNNVASSSLQYTTSGEGEDISYTCTGGSISLSNVSANLNDCMVSGNTLDTYWFSGITISSLTVKCEASTASGGSDEEETDDPSEEIGVRFVFLSKKGKKISNNGTEIGTRDNNSARMVGIQNVSSVGVIQNPKDWTSGMPRVFNAVDGVPGIGTVFGVGMVNTEDNSPAKTDVFDALVGHGYDSWTITGDYSIPDGSKASAPLKNSSAHDYNRRSGYVNEDGDNTAMVMEGGSQHIEGLGGWVVQGDELLGDDISTTVAKRKASRTSTGGGSVCMDGFNGGCPGSLGVTGIVTWSLTGIRNVGGVTGYGIVGNGKGSVGAIKSKNGYKVSSNSEITLQCIAGAGGSFAINELDGYSGGKIHSDTASASTQLIYPARKARNGGYGYYGGGHGGGGGFIRRKKDTTNPNKVTSESQVQGANGTKKTQLPCAVIVYMGKKNR